MELVVGGGSTVTEATNLNSLVFPLRYVIPSLDYIAFKEKIRLEQSLESQIPIGQ